jgi:hypothetical protein
MWGAPYRSTNCQGPKIKYIIIIITTIIITTIIII